MEYLGAAVTVIDGEERSKLNLVACLTESDSKAACSSVFNGSVCRGLCIEHILLGYYIINFGAVFNNEVVACISLV